MLRRAFVTVLVLCLGALPAAAQAPAQKKEKTAANPAPADDPVVARVNGAAIYRSDVLALRATLPPQVQQEPMEKLYPRLMDSIVALTLVAQNARKEKLNEDPRVKKMTMLADEQVLQEAYVDNLMKKEVTEAKLRARYAEYVKTAPSREEVHARHILVPTEKEAKEIIDELKKGADFAKLAAEKTTDPAGKASGGDLGYFTENDMVPEFAHAAFALKAGQFSQTPVKTQFGWHVIKVEDRRAGKPASYEQIAPELARQMEQEVFNARLKELASVSKIEVFNPDGSPLSPPAPAPGPRAGAAPMAAAPSGPASPGEALPSADVLPIQNGTPSLPPANAGPPKLAPATAPENLGK